MLNVGGKEKSSLYNAHLCKYAFMVGTRSVNCGYTCNRFGGRGNGNCENVNPYITTKNTVGVITSKCMGKHDHVFLVIKAILRKFNKGIETFEEMTIVHRYID